MMIFAVSAGLAAAACGSDYSGTETAEPAVPKNSVLSPSEKACYDYGFALGTSSLEWCAKREREERLRGRVDEAYSVDKLADDARDACEAYGVGRSLPGFNTCVDREIEERRFRGSVAAVEKPNS